MLQTEAYQRIPFIIEAVRVTLENMPEVVAWCGGNLRTDDQHRPYIKVNVHQAANVKQTMGFEGDWVLRSKNGFKVYTDYAFNKSFERITLVPDVDPYQTGNVFNRPDVDRVVVEDPVGDEKEVQPDSVEQTLISAPQRVEKLEYGHPGELEFGTPVKTPFARTPGEIREAHRTGGPRPSPTELSAEGREAFRRLHGHYPGENGDNEDA